MTSNMVTGERRWASSTRRGGKTVLGKVVVPKPINLPSQRLENHGLDPNVDIVPKGTHSWGNRSSSNAWGSSVLSPKTDSGRPSSSGGSGTRPSTAGSDRSSEPTVNAWGSNSRPSSASGTLTSNQTSLTSLRPRSAETRPGSSQLSRFAELSHETPVARVATGTADKLVLSSVVATSENDGFSLSSGDFPTLGSEKENSTRNAHSQDHGSHGRPSSSSGGGLDAEERNGTSPDGDDVTLNENAKSGTPSAWRDDKSPYVGVGVRPNIDQWQEGSLYQNPHMPPQQFPPWHGTPVGNSPAPVWYRGPPGGPPFGPPPYGPPVAPGGFPMGHPYYRPQIPGQPVPPHVPGPRGHQLKNGDMYRPHMPDTYIRPGMPMNPGFYPGQVTHEGFYAPPMGYCNAGKGDLSFMGTTAGPAVYNRYPNQHAPDSSNFRPRAGGYGPAAKSPVSEQPEYGHSPDPHGQYKVLLKQRSGWDEKEREQKSDNSSDFEKGHQPTMSSWENDGGPDYCKDEQMVSKRIAVGEEISQQVFQNRDSSGPAKAKLPENVGNAKAVAGKPTKGTADNLANNLKTAGPSFSEVPAVPKDSTLIQKIEGLNAKARVSDRLDVTSISKRGEGMIRSHVNAKAFHSTIQDSSGTIYQERMHNSGVINPASDDSVLTGDRRLKPAVTGENANLRRASHGMQARIDHHGKRPMDFHDAGRNESLLGDASSAGSALDRNIQLQDRHMHMNITVKSDSNLERKEGGESTTSMSGPNDIQAQRAKMREIAKQRAQQRQKEEEERIKEQKAKALAKLEELNKRTQAVEVNTQKLEEVASSATVHHIREEPGTLPGPPANAGKIGAPSLMSDKIVARNVESSTSIVPEYTVLSDEPPLEIPRKTQQKSDDFKIAPHYHESSFSKKHAHIIPSEKGVTEVLTSITTEPSKKHDEFIINSTSSTEVIVGEIAVSCKPSTPFDPNSIYEGAVHQRKKNSRSGRNKLKAEEASSLTDVPSIVSKETNHAKASLGTAKPKFHQLELQPNPIQSLSSSKDTQPSEQHSALVSEEHHGRMNNQWKAQNSRKLPRNHHAHRVTDKLPGRDSVIWAPVQSQNKEVNEEASQKSRIEQAVSPTRKSDSVQSNMKNRRAEMERYVPKPVAKEMAQQANAQQPISFSANQLMTDEAVSRAESDSRGNAVSQPTGPVTGTTGLSAESRNGESKQNKQIKVHASWRQRVSTELTVQDGSALSSEPGKSVQEYIGDNHPSNNADSRSMRGQSKSLDEWNTPDERDTSIVVDLAVPVTLPVAKDHGMTSRGKRQHYKGQRGKGSSIYDHDPKNINSKDADEVYTHYKEKKGTEYCNYDLDSKNINSGDFEPNETDRGVAKENRGVGERSTSHWLPKSQAFSARSQRDMRPGGRGQNVGEVGRFVKKGTSHGEDDNLHSKNEEIGEIMNQPRIQRSKSAKGNVGQLRNAGNHETKRERKEDTFKERSLSPNLGSITQVEPPSSSVDPQNELQRPSSGSRKFGSQNSRYGRGHDSLGDRSSAIQDWKQHNQTYNRGRQRQSNPQYEYQPVSPLNDNKSNDLEGPTQDSSHNSTSRFRDKGPGHSRGGGGNFYGRQVQDVCD